MKKRHRSPSLKVHPVSGMRRCAACREIKPITEFHRSTQSGGTGAYCKPCKMARKRTDAATFAWEASDKDRARFAGKFKVNEEGCHIWHSSIGRHGYGLFYMNGRQLSAHRIAWFLSGKGEPPAWPLVLDHICRNTGCVNVEHLRIVPQGDNCTHLAAGGPFKRNLETGVCIHGHSFTPENTAITLDNRGKPTRTCLSCNPSRWRFAVVEPKSPEKARFTKWGGWRGPASTEYINASGIIRFW